MRKLASIRSITSVFKHPNADSLDIITIDGWQCVAKKDEFRVDDLCVYFEIDSFLPNVEIFNFLGTPKNHQGRLGHRIRTMKLRKELSQGLALPLKMVKPFFEHYDEWVALEEGDDVTKILDVIKYDNEIKLNNGGGSGSKPTRSFPSFVRKTDQERIQNLTRYFETHANTAFEETLKLDGSSMTIYKTSIELPWYKKIINNFMQVFPTTKFGVCSRNVDLPFTESNRFCSMANRLGIKDDLPVGYAVQGELVSPNIQSNHEKVSEDAFYVFDVFNIKEQRYLSPIARREFLNDYLPSLNHVPVVNDSVQIFQECTDINQLLQRVEGESMNKGTVSEGRVYKSTTNPDITFKCISNKYLLKKK